MNFRFIINISPFVSFFRNFIKVALLRKTNAYSVHIQNTNIINTRLLFLEYFCDNYPFRINTTVSRETLNKACGVIHGDIAVLDRN